MNIEELKRKVLAKEEITKEEALSLVEADLDELTAAADEIRASVSGNSFDMCAIMNVKGGRCSENCKFCSQSSCSSAEIPTFEVRDEEFVGQDARAHSNMGITHYCQVASGRKISESGLEQICKNVREICATTDLTTCVSLGLLSRADLIKLKEAGVKRIHNNLETSRNYFNKVCTSHTYEDKMQVMRMVHEVGLELCSGGIFGIGETWEDRIDMALTLREFKPESVPINMLNPIEGTPMGEYEHLTKDEIRRIIAIYRFILPESYIRLAAGRGYMDDNGKDCFLGGCNATITGNMLTVKGISMEQDLDSIASLGYELRA